MENSKNIRYLIAITAVVAALCSALNPFFLSYFRMNGPQFLLSLSAEGLSHWYIWQPITYLFTLSSGQWGITFGFLLELFFAMYILWATAEALEDRIGSANCIKLYFTAGVIAGLLTIGVSQLIGNYLPLSGPTASLLALFTCWMLFYPESELMFFFIVSVKAKWLLLIVLAVMLLGDLSSLDLRGAIFHLTGAFIGYLYATVVWGVESPWCWTTSIDRRLNNLGSRLRRRNGRSRFSGPAAAGPAGSKVFDFRTGQAVVSDDQFMDAMLDKISKQGERSLSWSERRRMKKISDKKSKPH
jgi:membrane associated rhomboid family serine protease